MLFSLVLGGLKVHQMTIGSSFSCSKPHFLFMSSLVVAVALDFFLFIGITVEAIRQSHNIVSFEIC